MNAVVMPQNAGSYRFSGSDHFSGQIIRKTPILEETEPVLTTGFEDSIALEKKSDHFSAKPVVHCI